MEPETEKNMQNPSRDDSSFIFQSKCQESMPERNALPPGETISSSPEQFCVRPVRQRQAPKWMKDYVCYV